MARFFAELKHILAPRPAARVVRRLFAHDAMALGGQLAYFFVLFLFPFLIFLVSLVGLVVDDPQVVLQVLVGGTRDLLPPQAMELLSSYLGRTLRSTTSSIFLVSGLLTLVAGAASAESVIIGANRSYGVGETRPFWKRWGIAAFLIVGLTLLVATMAFLVLSPEANDYLRRVAGVPGGLVELWIWLRWAIVFLNLALALDVLFHLAPNAPRSFRWITPGGILTTIILLISSRIFIFWASSISRSEQLFGQLGAGVVLLLWLFVMGVVVLAGTEINAELDRAVGGYEGAGPNGSGAPPDGFRTGELRTTLPRFLADLRHALGPTALRQVARRLLENGALSLSGQLAYFFILFLFPFLVFMVSFVGLTVGNPKPILVDLATRAEDFLPRGAVEPVRAHLGRALQSTSSPTFVSSILFTVGVGSAAAAAITDAANRSYGVRETRPFWKVRGIAVLIIFGFTALIAILIFAVLSPGAYLQREIGLPEGFAYLRGVLGWALTFLAITLALDVLYYLAPAANVPFKWVTPGGFVATGLLLLSNQVLNLFLSNASFYDLLYGQLGTAIVLLVWLYVAGLMVLVGLETNAVLARRTEARRDKGGGPQG